MIKHRLVMLAAASFFFVFGCSTSHKVEVAPVEVKPIHITIDVNVKVDKALDDFFGDVDSAEEEIDAGSTETE